MLLEKLVKPRKYFFNKKSFPIMSDESQKFADDLCNENTSLNTRAVFLLAKRQVLDVTNVEEKPSPVRNEEEDIEGKDKDKTVAPGCYEKDNADVTLVKSGVASSDVASRSTKESVGKELNFVLVDSKELLVQALEEIKSIAEDEFLAVDCEGRKLGRGGSLDVLTIATKKRAFLIDVLILGQSAFDSGIKTVLESCTMRKLMFDCRQDSDTLKHLYNVHLDGVVDVQLLEVLHNRELNGWKPFDASEYKNPGSYFNAMAKSVGRVKGYKKCIELYCDKSSVMAEVKSKVGSAMMKSPDIWTERPLSPPLQEYCAVDTLGMFEVYGKLMKPSFYTKLKVASARYADYVRRMPECLRGNDYVEHAFLPHNIIPESDNCSFPRGTIKCTGCKRMFSHDEFSKVQMRKRTQVCRVCRKIEEEESTQRSRVLNWEIRAEQRHNYILLKYNEAEIL